MLQCSLQFDKKLFHDLHQILIHNYKNKAKTFIKNEIKKDLKETELHIVTAKNLEKETLSKA